MTWQLEKRVEHLEQQQGKDSDFLLIVLGFMEPNPEAIGPDRAFRREVTGFKSMQSDQEWLRQPGETLEDTKARMHADLRRTGARVCLVAECD